MPALLELKSVSKEFPSPGRPLRILDAIDLTVDRGESLAVVGPSGCGKSTLLNLMGALDRPSAGEISLEGRNIATFGEAGLAAYRNRHVGFIFQLHHLLPQCTVLENALLPTLAGWTSRPERENTDRARELLDWVGLGPRLTHRPGQLSGGERQRVAVVRALINQPALVLADEPTGSLDADAAARLADLLLALNDRQGVAVVLVTHAPDLAARMGRTLRLRDGRIDAP